MALSKNVLIDQIEITRSGIINIRFNKNILNDDGTVLHHEYHRTALTPGQDIDNCMEAVNRHLEQLNYPPVSKEEYASLVQYAAIKWTPEIVAAHKELQSRDELQKFVNSRPISSVVF